MGMDENQKKHVTCVGGANIDIQGFSGRVINLRDSNPGAVRLCPGGVGRNIAENLAWFGADVQMVSAVGEDPFAEIILKSCSEAGIDVSNIERIPGKRSSVYLVLTDSDGDMLAAISDMHILKEMDAGFILRHADAFEQADAIVLDPNLSPESLEALISGWSRKPLFADPISTTYAASLKKYLGALHMIKCNRQEAEIFAEMPIHNDSDLERAADRILKTGTECAVITLGSDGVFYKDKSGLQLRKFHKPLDPVSATGAGDSFTAAMVYGWLNRMTPETSLELAMTAAEITIMSEKTVTPEIRMLVSG